MNYFSRPEVSNSDLSWLENQLNPKPIADFTDAFRFGNLIDGMITENFKVDYINLKYNDIQFNKSEFKIAEKMKASFLRDPFCIDFINDCETQVEMFDVLETEYNSIDIKLHRKCKWDAWKKIYGGDIKSTVATTQKQFEQAVYYFGYHRQRAWYMDIAKSDVDVIIGISKKNYKIFKVFIDTNSEIYKKGKEDYMDLAIRHYLLFGEYKYKH
jgi:hypothetical protein